MLHQFLRVAEMHKNLLKELETPAVILWQIVGWVKLHPRRRSLVCQVFSRVVSLKTKARLNKTKKELPLRTKKHLLKETSNKKCQLLVLIESD
jgi:hypothetical protein